MPIEIYPDDCVNCRLCYEECPVDVFTWDEATRLPVVSYLEECFYCNVCEVVCPTEPKSIKVVPPLVHQIIGWVEKLGVVVRRCNTNPRERAKEGMLPR